MPAMPPDPVVPAPPALPVVPAPPVPVVPAPPVAIVPPDPPTCVVPPAPGAPPLLESEGPQPAPRAATTSAAEATRTALVKRDFIPDKGSDARETGALMPRS